MFAVINRERRWYLSTTAAWAASSLHLLEEYEAYSCWLWGGQNNQNRNVWCSMSTLDVNESLGIRCVCVFCTLVKQNCMFPVYLEVHLCAIEQLWSKKKYVYTFYTIWNYLNNQPLLVLCHRRPSVSGKFNAKNDVLNQWINGESWLFPSVNYKHSP